MIAGKRSDLKKKKKSSQLLRVPLVSPFCVFYKLQLGFYILSLENIERSPFRCLGKYSVILMDVVNMEYS